MQHVGPPKEIVVSGKVPYSPEDQQSQKGGISHAARASSTNKDTVLQRLGMTAKHSINL